MIEPMDEIEQPTLDQTRLMSILQRLAERALEHGAINFECTSTERASGEVFETLTIQWGPR